MHFHGNRWLNNISLIGTIEANEENAKRTKHSVKFIDGVTNKILVVDDHKFYKSSRSSWTCRLRKSLG